MKMITAQSLKKVFRIVVVIAGILGIDLSCSAITQAQVDQIAITVYPKSKEYKIDQTENDIEDSKPFGLEYHAGKYADYEAIELDGEHYRLITNRIGKVRKEDFFTENALLSQDVEAVFATNDDWLRFVTARAYHLSRDYATAYQILSTISRESLNIEEFRILSALIKSELGLNNAALLDVEPVIASDLERHVTLQPSAVEIDLAA